MSILDLLWMAIKNLKARLLIFPVALMAASTFCLCFAGTVLVIVQQEKSLPYEINVLSDTAKLTDSVITKLSEIPGVTAVTPVLEVPVSAEASGYKAQLTLVGIDADYLNEAFATGESFPDSSVMPYIVLNKAACKLFKDEKNVVDTDETAEPPVDWLNTAVSVRISESAKPVVSKIVGLLFGEDEDQEPAAYISITSAKALLHQNGLDDDSVTANVRVTNAGCAESVSEAAAGIGLSISNPNEVVQVKWDMELKEMTYLIIIGVFGLLFSAFLTSSRRTQDILKHRETYSMLQWIGMKDNDIGNVFVLQSFMIGLLGISVGIIIGISVPSFLSPELLDTSIFALRIPVGVTAVSAVICVIFGILPFLRLKQYINKHIA